MTHRLNTAIALLCALACLGAGAEVAATKEKTFSVKYKDDAVERYQATWKAEVTTTVKEEGGSPVPYQGSVDKFRCTWTIAVTIERAVALATRLGPSFPLPGMSRTFKDDSQGRGGDYLVTGARDLSCKASAAERDGAIATAKNNVRGLFERLTEADLESLKQEIRSKSDVVTITVQ